MMNVNKKWCVYIKDETSEDNVKEIATIVTPEVPTVGNFVKFCKVGTYEIVEVINIISSANKDLESHELFVREDVPYIVDKGDNNGHSVYGVGVKLVEEKL